MSMQRILKIYKQAKLNGEVIPYNIDPIEILRMAEEGDNLYRLRKDIYFTAYKTQMPELDNMSIIIVFTIKLPNLTTGSSASSEFVMDVVSLIENLLSPIAEYKYFRNIDGINKNIAILKIVKAIEPNYY